MKTMLLTISVLIAAGLCSMQSHAVAYSGQWTLNKNNSSFAVTPMRNKNTHFCYLSKVEFEETDTGGESARCRVYRSSGSDWFLEARLGASSDADAYCSAICYSN